MVWVCMERWKRDLLNKVCVALGTSHLLGQRVKFEVANDKNSGTCEGFCNRDITSGPSRHPEGPIIATDFGQDQEKKRSWIRIYIELEDTKGMGSLPHYIEFDGMQWTWDEYCGGYPADRYFSKHSGRIIALMPA